MTVDIVFMREDLTERWRAACEAVVAERIYLGRVTMPAHEFSVSFAKRMIDNDWPMYVAMDGDQLVGWADINPPDIPECRHRGVLGMGVVASHRGAGTGRRLLETCLDHCGRSGIEKVELTVYTSNTAAIALYRRLGFTDAGVLRDWRRLDGVSYDALNMELFLR